MRVTNKLMAATVNSHLFKSTEQLLKIQNMISSGKRINKPSDDPIGIGNVLDYRKTISSIDQYLKNIGHGNSWLNITDSTLGSVDNLLISAKEVAVDQSTETSSAETRAISAEKIENIYDQILQLANTKFGNSYIFSGYSSDTAPFSRDDNYDITYHGVNGEKNILIGEGVTISLNVNGDDAFINGVNIFDVLRDLKEGLENNDTVAISGQIELFDDALNQILNARTVAGSKINRMETTENHWNDFKLNMEQMLSETQDADFIKAMTDLTAQQTAYQATLAVSANIIQSSLINFLK